MFQLVMICGSLQDAILTQVANFNFLQCTVDLPTKSFALGKSSPIFNLTPFLEPLPAPLAPPQSLSPLYFLSTSHSMPAPSLYAPPTFLTPLRTESPSVSKLRPILEPTSTLSQIP